MKDKYKNDNYAKLIKMDNKNIIIHYIKINPDI